MWPALIPIGVGGLLGAALGYFGQCSSGTCPLTSTWWRGALYGAALGAMFGFGSNRRDYAETTGNSTNVLHIAQSEFEAVVLNSDQAVERVRPAECNIDVDA